MSANSRLGTMSSFAKADRLRVILIPFVKSRQLISIGASETKRKSRLSFFCYGGQAELMMCVYPIHIDASSSVQCTSCTGFVPCAAGSVLYQRSVACLRNIQK